MIKRMNSSDWLISDFPFVEKYCKTHDKNYHKPSAIAR